MNANQKKVSAGQRSETKIEEQTVADLTSPSSDRIGMVAVAADELGKVEGGYGIGTRTGDSPVNFFRRR